MDSLAQMQNYEAYKDSSVAWLESVPSHWEEYPIVAKATLKSISNCINEDLLSVYLDRGVIRFEDAEQKRTNVTSLDLSKYQLVEIGDFVLNNQQAWRGSVGVSAYRGIVSPAYLVLSLSKDLIPNFANYLFRDGAMVSHYLICSKGVGTIQRNLYWPQLKRVPIYLPPIAEQCKIADFLDQKTTQIDEAIAIKEKQIALLKERKQIIIQQAVTQGLDPNVPMKDSGVDWIGQIPEHWESPKLKLVCKFILDGTHGSYPRVEDGYRLLSVRNIVENKFVFREDDSRVSLQHFKEISSKFKVSEGDIQLAIVGATLGKVAVVEDLPEEIVTQRSVSTIRVRNSSCINKFVAFFMRSEAFQSYLWNNAGFSAQPGVYLNTIQNAYIALPPISEQSEIIAFIESVSKGIDEAISIQKHQIDKLKEYKTTLINSAVTGKIKVA